MKNQFLTSVLFLFYFNCHAQWANNAMQNTLVRDDPGMTETTPMMATINDGSTYISWFQPVAGTNFEFRMQRLDKDGYKMWGNNGLLVSNFPQNSATFRYDLKTDLDGNAIAAFQDERSGHLDIVVYKIDLAGNFSWSTNGIALTDPASTQGLAPTIGITNSNNVVITWNASSGSTKWIAMQKISSSGTVLWPSVIQIKDPANTKKYSRPTSVPFGVDDFTVLYVDETGSGLPPGKMLAQHYDTAGAAVWINPTLVSTYTIPFFFFPVAISDHNNGFYVGFNTSLPSSLSVGVVYLQHVDATGNTWNSIGTSTSLLPNSHKFTPATLFNANANCIYVLLKVTDSNQGQSGIYMQKVDTSGNILWGANATQLIPVTAAYNDPNGFSITPTGIIISYTTGSIPNPQTINAVKIDSAGVVQWNGNSVTLCSNTAGKDDVAQGIFAQNEVVIVWNDDRNGGGIYAQNIHDDGTIGMVTGVNNLESDNDLISVYPNPSNNLQINLKSTVSCNAILQLSDLTGRILLVQSINLIEGSNQLPIENKLTKGIYIVDLNIRGKQFQQKWIKN